MPTQPHDASVKHFRHEAEAAQRVSRNLPRLSGASTPAVLAADVGLQETQHVIAREQGYTQWAELIDGDAPRFESITELSDADMGRRMDQAKLRYQRWRTGWRRSPKAEVTKSTRC
jgi:hypothetical protein